MAIRSWTVAKGGKPRRQDEPGQSRLAPPVAITDTELLAVVVDGSVPDPFDAALGLGAASVPRTAVGEGGELAGGAAREGDGDGGADSAGATATTSDEAAAVGAAVALARVARTRSAT